jgi:threonine dehydrogenase-like Zn-dependent dehydrogenase
VRAFVITAPGQGAVQDVDPPTAQPGEVVVDVRRAGICGTDAELFRGHTGLTPYPVRIGHEWMGTVSSVGDGVSRRWIGRRVTGDTMLGCGKCRRCRDGRHHVCGFRAELGIRGARPGALADQVAVPETALYELPGQVSDIQGALVEPGGNALRAVRAAALRPGDRLLVEPGKRVVYIGLAATPSLVNSRELVLKDVTATGILGASAGLSGAIDTYARGEVDPTPLVAAVVNLEHLAPALAGEFPDGAGPGPKIHVAF